MLSREHGGGLLFAYLDGKGIFCLRSVTLGTSSWAKGGNPIALADELNPQFFDSS